MPGFIAVRFTAAFLGAGFFTATFLGAVFFTVLPPTGRAGFFTAIFITAFFPAGVFFATAFFTAVFFAGDLFTATFFSAGFFTAAFRSGVSGFRVAPFRPGACFFTGVLRAGAFFSPCCLAMIVRYWSVERKAGTMAHHHTTH